jgi:hypothetical protein
LNMFINISRKKKKSSYLVVSSKKKGSYVVVSSKK